MTSFATGEKITEINRAFLAIVHFEYNDNSTNTQTQKFRKKTTTILYVTRCSVRVSILFPVNGTSLRIVFSKPIQEIQICVLPRNISSINYVWISKREGLGPYVYVF